MVKLKKTTSEGAGCAVDGGSSENCFCGIFGYYIGCFRKYACLGGRASRMEFFSFFVINFLIGSVLGYLSGLSPLFFGLSALYSIVAFTPFCAVMTRRLHDTDHSGWILAFSIIVIFVSGICSSVFFTLIEQKLSGYGFLSVALLTFAYLVFLLFKRGDELPNKYDSIPSHPYRDGVILVVLICLYYGLGFYALYYAYMQDNQDILPIDFDRTQIDVSDVQKGLPAGFTLQDLWNTDDEMNNTVTVIEETDDESDDEDASVSEKALDGNVSKGETSSDESDLSAIIMDSEEIIVPADAVKDIDSNAPKNAVQTAVEPGKMPVEP